MPFKTITIKRDVYRELTKTKKNDESFSELFTRMLRDKRPNLKEFYGAWKLEKGEEKKIEIALERERLRFEENWKNRLEKEL